MKYILILLASLSLLSCKEKKQELKDKQKEIETGTLDSTNRYSADEIGWTTSIPSGWEVQTRENTKKNTERGLKAIEKEMNAEVDASKLIQLLNLKKGKFNSFLSTIEPYDTTDGISYEENNRRLYEVMKQTYAGQGIDARYSEDIALLDGLSFYVFNVKIYNKDKSTVILNQTMYSRLINGYDFGMTISYNGDEARKELEDIVFSSKFSKRFFAFSISVSIFPSIFAICSSIKTSALYRFLESLLSMRGSLKASTCPLAFQTVGCMNIEASMPTILSFICTMDFHQYSRMLFFSSTP